MKVSILIPLYNSEPFIADSIQSALDQTWREKEIIVVDDGSTDRSLKVAKSFEKQGIKVHSQKNKGASAARNFAFSLATGDLIQYLDADDQLSPNKIEEQVKLYQNYQKQDIVVSCNFLYFNNNLVSGIQYPACPQLTTNYNPNTLMFDIFDKHIGTQTSIWLVPKSIIEACGGWDETISLNDDGEFFFRVLAQCSKIVHSNHGLVYYRIFENGLSKQRDAIASSSYFKSVESMTAHLLNRNNSKKVKLACAKYYLRLYGKFEDNGRYDQQVDSILKAWKINPDKIDKQNSLSKLFNKII